VSDRERKSVEELLQSLKFSVDKKNVAKTEIIKEVEPLNKEKKAIIVSDIVKEMIASRLEEVFEDEVNKYFEQNSSDVKKNFVSILEKALEEKSQWLEQLIKQAIEARLDKIIG